MTESRLPRQGEYFDEWDVAGSDGWTPLDAIGDTYAYVSPSSLTITSPSNNDYSAWFKKGCRVKLTNTTLKFFVVSADATYSAGVTTVTGLLGGTDYSLANVAISGLNISFGDPPDYPEYFNYSPTITGYSANPTSAVYQFRVRGKTCKVLIREGANGTSSLGIATYSLPIAAKTVTNGAWSNNCRGIDNGVSLTTPALLNILSAATVIDTFKDYAGAAWTASGGKRIVSGDIEYPI